MGDSPAPSSGVWALIRICLSTLLVVLVSATASAQNREPANQLVLYENPGFDGNFLSVSETIADLRATGLDDLTSSISVTGGIWEICKEPGFKGSCHVFDADLANMTGWTFDDAVSSVRPVVFEGDDARFGVTLYSEPGFQGESLILTGNSQDLRSHNFDNTVGSIVVHRGEWQVCSRDNYDGRCEILHDSHETLAALRLDKIISSIRMYEPLIGGPGYIEDDTAQVSANRNIQRLNVNGGTDGVDTEFYGTPRVNGRYVAACPGNPGRSCTQQTADLFCESAGHIRSLYFDVRETSSNSVWNIADNSRGRSGDVLVNVLCATR